MVWMSDPHVWQALAATLFLMFAHALGPWFARFLRHAEHKFVSFSGGVSVAYVFLDMLPNLVEYNKPIGQFLISNQWLTPFTELLIYFVALMGFLLYYGLDLCAERYQVLKNSNAIVYQLHLWMFCLYNGLITYTMSLRSLMGWTYVVLFTAAMALHFILTDRKFCRLYPHRFNRLSRVMLLGSLFGGWFISALFDPVNVLFVALMMAFLAGSILLNVFREELPQVSLARFRWFVLGACLVAGILLLQTWIAAPHKHPKPNLVLVA